MTLRGFLLGLACCTFLVPALAEDDPTVKALADLDAAGYETRIAGARALRDGKPTKAVINALVRRLGDPDWGVQIAVCDALARLAASEPTVALAEKAVMGDVFFVRDAALRAVLDLDRPKAIGWFLKTAKSGKGENRLRAIRALAELRDERLAGEFAALAKDKDPWVRGESLRALGSIAKGKLGAPILDGLRGKGFATQFGALCGAVEWSAQDEKERKRILAEAAAFLAAARSGYVLRRAKDVLGSADSTAFTEALRAEWAKANPDTKAYLAQIVSAVGLRDLAPDVRDLARQKDEKLRAGAAAALAGLADDATRDLLRGLLADPSPLVQTAAYRSLHRTLGERVDPGRLADYPAELRLLALGDLGREKAGKEEEFVPLAKLMADEDWRVACAAAVTLGKLFQAHAIPTLEAPAKSPDWRQRGAVAVALTRILHKESIPPLLDLLQDKHAVVQGAALKGLQHLTRQTFGPEPARWRAWWAANQEKFAPFNPQDVLKGLRDSGYGTDEYIYKLFQNMEILVVTGAWDHVEQVLDDLKLKHQVIAPSELTQVHLNPRQILLLNCGSQVGGKNSDVLLWYVVTGGYLMSTDWTIQDTLERLWPTWLTSYKKDATNDDVVRCEPCSGDRLLRNVFADHARTKVWLEITSFGIQITNPYLVDVLVDSEEMAQKYNLEPLCVSFDYGHGRVFHSMSHFFLQKQSLQNVRTKQELKIFAVDHLGLDVDQVRALEEKGDFDAAGKEPLSRHYPVFKIIVNYVDQRLKRELDEE